MVSLSIPFSPVQRKISRFLTREYISSFIKGSFFSNSVYILLAQVLGAGFGLLFWFLAAILYPQEDVGVATALISSASLILLFSRLGIDQSMTRFLPLGDRTKIFSSTLIVTTVLTAIVGIGYLLTSALWIPDIQVGWDIALMLLLLVFAQNIASLSNTAFISVKKAKLTMVQNIVMGSRVALLFVTVTLGAAGIIGAFMVSFVLSIVFGQYHISKLGIVVKSVDWKYIRESIGFSTGNWISGLFINLPKFVLPIIVLSYFGAAETAVYYLAYSIAAIAFMLPSAITTQMYIEGCHGSQLRGIVIKSTAICLVIMVPAIAALYLMAPWLLGLIGPEYAEAGLTLLRLLAISSIFQIPFLTFVSVKMVKKDMRGLVLGSVLNCVLLIGLSFGLMVPYGLDGIGSAWILAFAITSFAVVIPNLRGLRAPARRQNG